MLKTYRILSYVISGIVVLSVLSVFLMLIMAPNLVPLTKLLKFYIVVSILTIFVTISFSVKTNGINFSRQIKDDILDSNDDIEIKKTLPDISNSLVIANLLAAIYFILAGSYKIFTTEYGLTSTLIATGVIIVNGSFILFGFFQIYYVFAVAGIYRENKLK